MVTYLASFLLALLVGIEFVQGVRRGVAFEMRCQVREDVGLGGGGEGDCEQSGQAFGGGGEAGFEPE